MLIAFRANPYDKRITVGTIYLFLINKRLIKYASKNQKINNILEPSSSSFKSNDINNAK